MSALGGKRSPAKARFDSIASRYEAWYERPANQLIDRLERRALEDLLPAASGTGLLLDAGVGTGHWVPLAREAGYTVIGLDISADMLGVAASRPDLEVLLVRGDAHCLPFPDGAFETVLSVTTLEFARDPACVVDEMVRCLRPGGALVAGVLNACSFLGLKRRLFRSPTFRGARFFTVGEVRRMLSGLGPVSVATCAFMPPWKWLLPLGERIERLGKAVFPRWGQLIVARVGKPGVDASSGRR